MAIQYNNLNGHHTSENGFWFHEVHFLHFFPVTRLHSCDPSPSSTIPPHSSKGGGEGGQEEGRVKGRQLEYPGNFLSLSPSTLVLPVSFLLLSPSHSQQHFPCDRLR